MTSIHDDPVTFYKKLEEECNKRIHAHTNTLSHVFAAGKELENHLDQVMIHRKLIKIWLNRLDIPNKDEITALAIRVIDCEGKLDQLEEDIYMANQQLKVNHTQLKKIRESLEEIVVFFERELKDIRGNKIQILEKELSDLKLFFHKETY